MMKFTKEASDTNYSRIASYIEEKGYLGTVASNLLLLFAISQSEEARDAHEVLAARELPIVESFHDLDASVELVKLGYYKQAFASLRMGLDNGLLSAHWNAVGYDAPEFKRWLSSKEKTPQKDRHYWRPIRRLRGVDDFYERFSFENAIRDLSDQLSNYVHTRGFWHSTMGEFQRRIRTQNENICCDDWYDLFVAATRIIVTLQLLVKPKLAIVVHDQFLLRKFGSYDEVPFCGVLVGDFSDRIKLCVGEAEYDAISRAADTSPEVKDVRKYLEECRDLRDEEIRKINFKFWKSNGTDDDAAETHVNETLRSIREFENKQ